MFVSDNEGLKDAMLKLETRFLDGDWTPFTTTPGEEKLTVYAKTTGSTYNLKSRVNLYYVYGR